MRLYTPDTVLRVPYTVRYCTRTKKGVRLVVKPYTRDALALLQSLPRPAKTRTGAHPQAHPVWHTAHTWAHHSADVTRPFLTRSVTATRRDCLLWSVWCLVARWHAVCKSRNEKMGVCKPSQHISQTPSPLVHFNPGSVSGGTWCWWAQKKQHFSWSRSRVAVHWLVEAAELVGASRQDAHDVLLGADVLIRHLRQ